MLATVDEGDLKAPFSLATHWIVSLYPCYVPYNDEC